MNWQSLKESDPECCVLLAYAASISDPSYRLTDSPGDEADRLVRTRARIKQLWKRHEIAIAEARRPRPGEKKERVA